MTKKPFCASPSTQRVRPDGELRAQAHDQQQGGIAPVAARLVFDLDAVGLCARHVASAVLSVLQRLRQPHHGFDGGAQGRRPSRHRRRPNSTQPASRRRHPRRPGGTPRSRSCRRAGGTGRRSGRARRSRCCRKTTHDLSMRRDMRSVSAAPGRPPIGERLAPRRRCRRARGPAAGSASAARVDLAAQRARLGQQRVALGPLAHQPGRRDGARRAPARLVADAQHGELEVGQGVARAQRRRAGRRSPPRARRSGRRGPAAADR